MCSWASRPAPIASPQGAPSRSSPWVSPRPQRWTSGASRRRPPSARSWSAATAWPRSGPRKSAAAFRCARSRSRPRSRATSSSSPTRCPACSSRWTPRAGPSSAAARSIRDPQTSTSTASGRRTTCVRAEQAGKPASMPTRGLVRTRIRSAPPATPSRSSRLPNTKSSRRTTRPSTTRSPARRSRPSPSRERTNSRPARS